MRPPRSFALLLGLALGCDQAEAERLDALDQRFAAMEEQLGGEPERSPDPLVEQVSTLEARVSAAQERAAERQNHGSGLTRMVREMQGQLADIRTTALAVDTGRFLKGQVAPRDLSEREIEQHATAQGDPHRGRFSLAQALAGDPDLLDRSRGSLVATFDTSHGTFDCTLREDDAPNTVANFVGLARGVRASLDPKTKRWSKRRLYDGTLFHRVIDGFMIQGGDPEGTGRGRIGYVLADEVDPRLKHVPGTLSMANRGPNTASSQFFIMVSKSPHLDGKHTIFGKCEAKVPKAIAKVAVDPRANHRPLDPVTLHSVTISRKP